MRIVLQGQVTPGDKMQGDYAYIPFELPEPARRLTVHYQYSAPISSDKREGGNVIDIGLFDPRGAGFPGGAGFRGWSGSARKAFTITPTQATPGYLPGPLPPGEYQVILGLYRVWEQGAEYEIEVEAELGADAMATGSGSDTVRPITPIADAAFERPTLWLRGDLQSHTHHSDAKGSLEQLTAKARALDLDFLAVTDHNTVSHHPYLAVLAGEAPSAGSLGGFLRQAPSTSSFDKLRTGSGLGQDSVRTGAGHSLLLIPGQEATSYYGHMNIWGTGRWCDFRCRSDEQMAAVIQLAHASGGLCSINHPKTDGPAWEYDLGLPVDAMEVWQGPWPWRNEQSLALWERLLKEGRRLPAVGGSDYHCPAREETGHLRLGQPTTWVKVAERSVQGVLEAIRQGRVSISAAPDGPRLILQARRGETWVEMGSILSAGEGRTVEVRIEVERGAGFALRLIADGEVAYEKPIRSDRVTLRASVRAGRYVRAELVGDAPRELVPEDAPVEIDLRGWRWALTNPVYIE